MSHREWVSYRATLANLRRRFPGIDAGAGKCVAEMADHFNGPEPVRAWVDIQAADEFPDAWHAWVHARLLDGQTFKFPVIPDEFNARADKLVKPEDPPHVFTYMSEAEKAAELAVDELKSTLKRKLAL